MLLLSLFLDAPDPSVYCIHVHCLISKKTEENSLFLTIALVFRSYQNHFTSSRLFDIRQHLTLQRSCSIFPRKNRNRKKIEKMVNRMFAQSANNTNKQNTNPHNKCESKEKSIVPILNVLLSWRKSSNSSSSNGKNGRMWTEKKNQFYTYSLSFAFVTIKKFSIFSLLSWLGTMLTHDGCRSVYYNSQYNLVRHLSWSSRRIEKLILCCFCV